MLEVVVGVVNECTVRETTIVMGWQVVDATRLLSELHYRITRVLETLQDTSRRRSSTPYAAHLIYHICINVRDGREVCLGLTLPGFRI